MTFEKQSHVETLFRSKKHLPKGIYIDREYTEAIEKERKILKPILRLAKSIPKYKGKSKLDIDTLVIQGRKYTTKTLHKLPEELSTFSSTSKTDGRTLAFFGELNPLSNFHPAPFVINGKEYHSSEQFIQETKSLYFKDEVTAKEIMDCDTALQCKHLSRDIRDYNHEDWSRVAKTKCKPGILEKFRNNPALLQTLKKTDEMTLVEACHDQLWGSGIPLGHVDCLKQDKWNSQGIMGEILMEIRSELCKGSSMETT